MAVVTVAVVVVMMMKRMVIMMSDNGSGVMKVTMVSVETVVTVTLMMMIDGFVGK